MAMVNNLKAEQESNTRGHKTVSGRKRLQYRNSNQLQITFEQ